MNATMETKIISDRKIMEDALFFVAQRGWQGGADSFFNSLARFLGETFNMDYVLVDKVDGNLEYAETVAIYAKGGTAPNMRYALKGTPCENVIGRQLCVYKQGIQQQFPDDALLTEMNVAGYIGIPLWDSSGLPIGLIAMLSVKPLSDCELITQVLQVVATRAAAELEREQRDRLLREHEYEFRTLAENLPDNIVRYGMDGRAVYVNQVLENTLGVKAKDRLGKRVREFHSDESFEVYAQAVDVALSNGEDSELEITLKVDGREPRIFQMSVLAERDENGTVTGAMAIGRDITEHKYAEHNLRDSEEKFSAAFHASPNLIAITKMSDGSIVEVNEGYTQILGYSRSESIGKTTTDLSIWADMSDRDIFVERLEKYGHVSDFETTLRRKDGGVVTVIDFAKTITLHGEAYILSVAHDITGRKEAEQEIERLAFQDPLTTLPNRRLLLDRLHQALVAGGRSKHRGALLFIDLDNFKVLNDTLGHDAGDQLLIEVARRLITCVREGDTVSRIGGDEFMLMLSDLGDNDLEAVRQIKAVGEKIMYTLNHPYTIAGQEHHSTPSVGVALFSGGEGSVDELMKQADIAMYQAKSGGRNTLRFFDPEMQAALAERAAMETALRRAIEDRQFTFVYQPQVDSDCGIVGAEALIRWCHPEQGIILPGQFIPLAEETGLIQLIGSWVLKTACHQLKVWANDQRTSELGLAINVSAHQFRQAGFADQVREALEESGAPGARLKIELTESLLLDDIENAIEKMRTIRQLGVGFTLDDFGTGYSSLSYLTRLPLNQLKIDRTFIQNLPYNKNDAVIAQTIVNMARSLNQSVIAEGVETEEQRQFLEQLGCTTFQGYLFSRPVKLEEFELLLDGALPPV